MFKLSEACGTLRSVMAPLTSNTIAWVRSPILALIPIPAEVPCSTAIRSAQGVVKDFGVSLAQQYSKGLVEISQSSTGNGERDAHRVMDDYGLTLPIPMTDLQVDCEGNQLPTLRLRDWMSFILRHRPRGKHPAHLLETVPR